MSTTENDVLSSLVNNKSANNMPESLGAVSSVLDSYKRSRETKSMSIRVSRDVYEFIRKESKKCDGTISSLAGDILNEVLKPFIK